MLTNSGYLRIGIQVFIHYDKGGLTKGSSDSKKLRVVSKDSCTSIVKGEEEHVRWTMV